jgi:phosphatidate cytidylyltransferase
MLRLRILTSIVAIPLLILLVWLGNPWFAIGIGILSILAGFEFYRIAANLKFRPLVFFGIAMILLLIFSYYFNIFSAKLLVLTSAAVISLIWILFRSGRENAFNNWVWTVGGILYIGLMMSYWVDLRNETMGEWWLLWATSIVIGCDTAAYFVGKSIGKHHLAPSISPNKTWEGAIGGVIGSVIAAVAIGALFKIFEGLPIEYWQMVILGIGISIIAQLGDLVESLLKRNAGIKDSGKFFPGHGGALDRLDSFLFTGALLFFYVMYFVH